MINYFKKRRSLRLIYINMIIKLMSYFIIFLSMIGSFFVLRSYKRGIKFFNNDCYRKNKFNSITQSIALGKKKNNIKSIHIFDMHQFKLYLLNKILSFRFF